MAAMLSSASLVLSPFLQTFASFAAGAGVAVVSLSKKNNHPRLFFTIVAILVFSGFYHSFKFSPFLDYNTIWARFQIIYLSGQAFLHLLVSQDELEEERRIFVESESDPVFARDRLLPERFSSNLGADKGFKFTPGQRSWHFAYHLSACSQYKGTRWEVRRRSEDPVKPQPSVSRSVLRFRRLVKLAGRCVALAILLDPALYLRLPGPGPPYPIAEDFSSSNTIFFRRILLGYRDTEELDLKRATVLRLHWFFTGSLQDYLNFTIGYDVLVILGVALHLDEPVQWQLYGNPAEAYTVRRYWARWHHLIVYRPLVSWAAKIVGRGGTVRRYAHNWFVFVVSGLMHSAVTLVMSPQTSLRCGFMGVTRYYALQPVGMIIEALAIRLLSIVEQGVFSKLQSTEQFA
ncbi:hypothetical protein CSOJ01_06513 [Colletotrichum sojae]|uniref:Wax synthase domain-containing protein n=1 Tax=Colletotrichum sojae TaxID=2175907 RepID=A0A8H6JCF2_9PEZI|nr:hypothetical protein CSOJ01_06513 [Colletotrichum sojae]